MFRKLRAARSPTRVRDALRLPFMTRKLAWEAAKLGVAVGALEVMRRVRAGPLTLRLTAPASVREGATLAVDARIESPFPLVEARAYFGGEWQPVTSLAPGTRTEKWLFRAPEPGLRPVLVTARDAEGHALTRTRWVLVLPNSFSRVRLVPGSPGRRHAAPPEPTAAR